MTLQGRKRLFSSAWNAGTLIRPKNGDLVTLDLNDGHYVLTPKEARQLAERLENRADLAEGGPE